MERRLSNHIKFYVCFYFVAYMFYLDCTQTVPHKVQTSYTLESEHNKDGVQEHILISVSSQISMDDDSSLTHALFSLDQASSVYMIPT